MTSTAPAPSGIEPPHLQSDSTRPRETATGQQSNPPSTTSSLTRDELALDRVASYLGLNQCANKSCSDPTEVDIRDLAVGSVGIYKWITRVKKAFEKSRVDHSAPEYQEDYNAFCLASKVSELIVQNLFKKHPLDTLANNGLWLRNILAEYKRWSKQANEEDKAQYSQLTTPEHFRSFARNLRDQRNSIQRFFGHQGDQEHTGIEWCKQRLWTEMWEKEMHLVLDERATASNGGDTHATVNPGGEQASGFTGTPSGSPDPVSSKGTSKAQTPRSRRGGESSTGSGFPGDNSTTGYATGGSLHRQPTSNSSAPVGARTPSSGGFTEHHERLTVPRDHYEDKEEQVDQEDEDDEDDETDPNPQSEASKGWSTFSKFAVGTLMAAAVINWVRPAQ